MSLLENKYSTRDHKAWRNIFFLFYDIEVGEFTSFESHSIELKVKLSVLFIPSHWPQTHSLLFKQESNEPIDRYYTLIPNET